MQPLLRDDEPPNPRRARRQAETVDRLPPHSQEAEQGVLGCILLDPIQSLGVCIDYRVTPPWFYDLRHQTIFDTLADMFDRQEAIDALTLNQTLKDAAMLEQVGGTPFIMSLQDVVPSAGNLTYYLDILREKYLLRTMLLACVNAVSTIYTAEAEKDPVFALDKIERDIISVGMNRFTTVVTDTKAAVNEAIDEIEAAMNRKGELSGIGSGFVDLDKMTGGFEKSDMIVIAGRPSTGKTSLAMNIVETVAVEKGIPVGVFSLEMKKRSLIKRMLCSRARVNLRDVRDGFLAERDYPKLTLAAGRVAKAPLYIDDTSGLSIYELRAKARRMVQQYGIKLFVIDYIGLLNAQGTQRRFASRQEEVSEISSGIKGLAKELDVPIIVLCQLNRELEKNKNRKPRLSDLRESGSIEQDADVVGLLYGAGNEEDEDKYSAVDAMPVNLLIGKQRNGPTGDVYLTFMKAYTRFENASKVEDRDVPNYDQQEQMAGV